MALSPTGAISASQINVEMGVGANTGTSFGSQAMRNLAQRPSGSVSMSDFRGKASYVPVTLQGIGDSYRQTASQTTTKTTTITPYVIVSNGKGPFNYQWSWQGSPPGLLVLSDANSATCRVSFTGRNASLYGTLQCVVTDTYNNTTYTVTGVQVAFEIGAIN